MPESMRSMAQVIELGKLLTPDERSNRIQVG
jgi:hypothetical protein